MNGLVSHLIIIMAISPNGDSDHAAMCDFNCVVNKNFKYGSDVFTSTISVIYVFELQIELDRTCFMPKNNF